MELELAVVIAVTFALTNGHDAANALATLVVTRGVKPGQAVPLSAWFNILGVLFAGTATSPLRG